MHGTSTARRFAASCPSATPKSSRGRGPASSSASGRFAPAGPGSAPPPRPRSQGRYQRRYTAGRPCQGFPYTFATRARDSRRGCARSHSRRTRLPLPWFRRKKQEEEQAPLAAAAPTIQAEPLIEPVSEEEPATDAQPTDDPSAPKKRRRGSRGGRGRKKKPDGTNGSDPEADAVPVDEKTPARTRK